MQNYELSCFLSQNLKETELNELLQRINSFIQKEEGVILKSGLPELKTLSYPIKRNRTAFWVNLDFNLSQEKIKDLQENLKKEGQILRFLLVVKRLSRKEPIKKWVEKKIKPEKKVELKEIEEKLEEILGE